MLDDHTSLSQGNDENSGNKGKTRAFVWDYFEKITGEDGLPKTKCTICNKVYCSAPNSGTSTMRRHLRKCCPQPLTQIQPISYSNTSDELSNEARSAKRLKTLMLINLQNKTDRELVEFIWMNKRNVGILEQKLPEKAVAIKEAIKCYEDEIDRRAKLQRPKENGAGSVISLVPVKIEVDGEFVTQFENIGENMADGESVVGGETSKRHADKNQEKTSPQVDKEKLVVKAEVGDQSDTRNENIDGIIAEEEHAGTLQIVAVNGDKNQASAQEPENPIHPQDIYAELKKVSSVLSMLTSPSNFYTPEGNPLNEEAEKAKQTLIELLNKNFETVVGSPDEEKVKSCVKILTKNLHNLPSFQGRVIETLNTEFKSACQSWKTSHMRIQINTALEVKQGDNLRVLQNWQEKDMDFESEIATVDADILRLQAELREKELTQERLVKLKSDLFSQSKISIDEAKKLLQEMVTAKLQSDVATDNMKELATKWERIKENFILKE